jgi:hypothetical protein
MVGEVPLGVEMSGGDRGGTADSSSQYGVLAGYSP